jgi:hypothetical protein
MKLKFWIWTLALVLIVNTVSALDLEIFNSNLQEKSIFSPGSEVIFKTDADEDVETVTLVVMRGSDIVLTERMKILSEEENQFAYLYKIPANEQHGDYKAKVMAKGETAEEEFYIGIEVKGQLMSSKDIARIKSSIEPSIWQKLLDFIIKALVRGFGIPKI